MEDIKVGEYVRITWSGEIGKVLIVREDGWCKVKFAGCTYSRRIKLDGKDKRIKHSKNIIDLIEVGDIVHTRDVLNEDIVYIWSEEYLKALKENLDNGIELIEILTKESYKANCYTVERKEK